MFFNLDKPVKAVAFGKVTQPHGNWHKGRTIPYNLLVYCVSGTVNINTKHNKYSVGEGELLLIPPNTFYIPTECNGCTYYFVHFTAETAVKSEIRVNVNIGAILPRGSYHYEYYDGCVSVVELTDHIRFANAESVGAIFNRMSMLDPKYSVTHKLLIDNLLRELLIEVSNEHIHKKQINKHLCEITGYIKTNYTKPHTLSELANEFSLSESYIAKLFKTHLQTKPSDYINNVKISIACYRILNTKMSITEISEELGYSSVYYFSRVFKKIKGVSPSEFRTY